MIALVVALALGAGIGWMDNRPGWDDTGITALALVIAGALMGSLFPRRPWLWAILIWIWLPAWSIVKAGTVTPGMIAWVIVLAFPMAGALLGTVVRRRLARA